MEIYLFGIVGFLAGAFVGYLWHQTLLNSRLGGIEKHGKDLVEKAKLEGEELLQQIRQEQGEKLKKARKELESEFRQRKKELERREDRIEQRTENYQRQGELLAKREDDIERRFKEIEQRQQELKQRNKGLDQKKEALKEKEREIKSKHNDAIKVLEDNAGLSREDAKRQIIERVTEEARVNAARQLRQIEEETRDEAERKAKRIIANATQRYASDYVTESTVSVVHLPSDDMKGRIIGREGRNIRALEATTGVNLIIDDTPEAVVISCFEPIRREVARRSLEKLVSDGRIHPARIEEVVKKTRDEMDVLIKEAGDEAVLKLDIGRVHPEVKRLLGKLKWRYSYGQNQWEHSIECGFLCGMMAAELGLNVKQARRAALLHDIGKAMTYEKEGSHALNGAEHAKKYGESDEIVHAIAAHHEEIKPNSTLAVLVQAADALSGGRPGARREALESYINRLRDLEEIAASFEGVEKVYAIQAGREIRVITNCDTLNDDQTFILCEDIARKVEKEMVYPGQIKVTVIRETRFVNFAK